MASDATSHPRSRGSRGFLYIATGTGRLLFGAVATAIPFIAQMNPDASTLAGGRPRPP